MAVFIQISMHTSNMVRNGNKPAKAVQNNVELFLYHLTSHNKRKMLELLPSLKNEWPNEHLGDYPVLVSYHVLRKAFWNAIPCIHLDGQCPHSTEFNDWLEQMHVLGSLTGRKVSCKKGSHDPSKHPRTLHTRVATIYKAARLMKMSHQYDHC